MGKFLIVRGVELSITTVALTVLVMGPALAAVPSLPGPAIGGLLAGAAIIGTLIITKWIRRK
jgi:hypothetical protein